MKLVYGVSIRSIFTALILLMFSIALSNVHAGVLDQLIGIDPPLQKRILTINADAVLDEEYRVRKYCAYRFSLSVIHKNKRMDDFRLSKIYRTDKKDVPINVHLDVLIKDTKTGGWQHVLNGDFVARPFGFNLERTSLEINSMILDKGEYQVKLRFLHDIAELKDADANFKIGAIPKSNCPKMKN